MIFFILKFLLLKLDAASTLLRAARRRRLNFAANPPDGTFILFLFLEKVDRKFFAHL